MVFVDEEFFDWERLLSVTGQSFHYETLKRPHFFFQLRVQPDD
jgi:hypothetical protein